MKRTAEQRQADYLEWSAMRRREARVETVLWLVAIVCVVAVASAWLGGGVS